MIAFMVGRLTVGKHADPKPGAVDIGFSQDMAVHHEQAVLMANLAMTRGGVAVKALANAILINQSQEVGLLRGWLTLWHQPAASPAPMAWMPDASPGMQGMTMSLPAGSTAMPGMASAGEIATLDVRRPGTAFDVLFLQLMIRHHQGGIEMAQYAQATRHLPPSGPAARAMAFAQIEDLAQLRPLLAADGGRQLPPPSLRASRFARPRGRSGGAAPGTSSR